MNLFGILKAPKGAIRDINLMDHEGRFRVIQDGIHTCTVEAIEIYPIWPQYTFLRKPGDIITYRRSEVVYVGKRRVYQRGDLKNALLWPINEYHTRKIIRKINEQSKLDEDLPF